MNWSGRVFFFLALSFLIYVIASGDGPKWKQLFTQKVASTTPTTSTVAAVQPVQAVTSVQQVSAITALAQNW